MPCPITIFTFGLLLQTDTKWQPNLYIIPLIWTLIGSSAVWFFGVLEDFGLLISGIIGLSYLVMNLQKKDNRLVKNKDSLKTKKL